MPGGWAVRKRSLPSTASAGWLEAAYRRETWWLDTRKGSDPGNGACL